MDTNGSRTGAAAEQLPAGTHIGVVSLQVSRLDRSIDYYTAVLGLDVLERSASHAHLGVVGEAHLLELHERAGAAPASHRQLGLYHFAILLPERAALGRIIRHLADRNERMGAADHLVSEAIYLYDPDNLGIEVYADRPRSQWRMSGGELAMASDPLDFDSLLAAAGDESWRGMPAGTTIGHMHLSVGDLARARTFYHRQTGLDVMVTRYPGALFLSAGGYHHHLGLNTWAGPSAAPPAEHAARLLRWELVVASTHAAAAAIQRLHAAEHSIDEVAPNSAWDISDPWGTVMRLKAFSPAQP